MWNPIKAYAKSKALKQKMKEIKAGTYGDNPDLTAKHRITDDYDSKERNKKKKSC